MMDLQSEVHEAMVELRPFVEERIREWLEARPHVEVRVGDPLTKGFCRGIAAGVREVLADRFPHCRWRIAGGYGIEYCTDRPHNLAQFADIGNFPGGMLDRSGGWHGHFWVVGGDPDGDGDLIVDLSADQFGHETVVVTDHDDDRYRENCLLGHNDKIRMAEHGWGTMLYAMWHCGRGEAQAGRHSRV